MLFYPLLLMAAWVICGFFAYGVTFAFFFRKYPASFYTNPAANTHLATTMFLLGPVGLVIAFAMTGLACKGLRWRA